jgi:hypothetical protein
MNNQLPTEVVDLETTDNTYWIEKKKSLDRLMANDDFKDVILEGYFKDKAINGVSLLATDYVKSTGQRPNIMEELVAISNLEDYFATISNLGAIIDDDDDVE